MFKRLTILALLIAILLVLIVWKSHTSSPVTTETSEHSTAYITMEYTITKISDNQYYGKADDGKEIKFSGVKMAKGENVQVHDRVICYFEKHNLGQGIVKVEKK